MTYPVSDKVVLVTGAARGIGEHTARLAAARGARLALLGLEPARLEALAAELGPGHTWVECDVTDQSAVERAVATVVDRLGGIDVVLANAGVANNGTVAVNPADALTRTIEVNLVGVVRTVSATLAHVTARRGHYLLVSSAAAFGALPGMAAYCASKAGVEQFGNVLRLEVAHKGVTVGVAHMTWIDTDMVRDVKSDLPSFRDALARLPGPMGAYTSVQECAQAFLDGITRRKRKIFVPRSLAVVSALRTLLAGPLGSLPIRLQARTMVPRLEAEVAALGRPFGTHSTGLARADEASQQSRT